jgi:hypothetical protein
LIPLRDRVRELREALFNPVPPAPVAAAVATEIPETGRVQIQNGTQTQGLAAGAKALLEGRGIAVDAVADAPQVYERTVIIDYKGRQKFIQRLATELGVPLTSVATILDANSPLDALVILGNDYQPR